MGDEEERYKWYMDIEHIAPCTLRHTNLYTPKEKRIRFLIDIAWDNILPGKTKDLKRFNRTVRKIENALRDYSGRCREYFEHSIENLKRRPYI